MKNLLHAARGGEGELKGYKVIKVVKVVNDSNDLNDP